MGCKVNQSGFNFYIHLERGYQDVAIVSEVIGDDTYELKELSQFMKTPKVILDIGGHIGSFGVFAKSLWPESRLIAVEADEENATLYKKNIWENFGLTDTVVINKALGYEKDMVFMPAVRTTGGGIVTRRDIADSLNKVDCTLSAKYLEVETITIEDIINEYEIDFVDLAKWDCEGAEIPAFKNMSLETKNKIGFMVGEVHPFRDSSILSPRGDYFSKKRIWTQIKRQFPSHCFEWNMDDNECHFIFKAWPK